MSPVDPTKIPGLKVFTKEETLTKFKQRKTENSSKPEYTVRPSEQNRKRKRYTVTMSAETREILRSVSNGNISRAIERVTFFWKDTTKPTVKLPQKSVRDVRRMK